MTEQRRDAAWAAGSVVGASGVITSNSGNFTCANGAAGINTLTLSEELDLTQCACLGTVRGATAGFVAIEHTSDAVKVLNTFSAAGVAADRDCDFLMIRY